MKWIYVVSTGDGNETIAPAGGQFVPSGGTITFSVSPNAGYSLLPTVSGSCPQGFFDGNTYTTGALTYNCELRFAAEHEIFAYLSPALNASSIDQFLLGNDGALLSYTAAYTASGAQAFGQMTFATVNGIQYACILDPNGAVYWCSILADGSFANCSATASMPPYGSWQARGIAFASFNAQYAYIVDPGNNLVLQCALDITGNFSNCQQSPSPYSLPTLAPYSIAFAREGLGAQHAYIADAGDGSGFGNILMCSMATDGSFSSCSQTPSSGIPNWIPVAITFNTVNGTQYAYVADNGADTPGHVYRCALNNDGSFANSGCIQTPVNDSSLSNWYPYYIAFQIINETKYAYVINSSGSSIGNLYRCLVNNDGSFSDCALTPNTTPLAWQPSGIAFR